MSSSALVISLDFELHWGVLDRRTIESYRANLAGTRAAIAAMLELFEEFSVEATWATVGFLFCESKQELIDMLPETRPRYENPALCPYRILDTVGADEQEAPYHFAPSVLRQIAATPGQEIATHTFSHYYCLEPGQDAACFRADLQAAVRIAAQKGYEIESIVFPRNQMNPAYEGILAEAGIKTFRGSPAAWMHESAAAAGETRVRRAARLADSYLPLANASVLHAWPQSGSKSGPNHEPAELMNVCGSHFLRPYQARFRGAEPVRLRRIQQLLDQAAASGQMYHLWWHPHNFGVHLKENIAFLREILKHFNWLRDTRGMQSYSMKGYRESVLY